MLSILIPTYNYDIRQLVRVLHAEATGLLITFEIIVREDASIHFSSENLEIEGWSNVVYHVNTKNLGRSATRQLLAKEANYENLLFLDADVLPYEKDFIKRYVEDIGTQVVCGGITYKDVIPSKNEMLRYVYGKENEEQSAAVRNRRPYFITGGNFMILKSVFILINSSLENFYGNDLLLSNNLKINNICVRHIDNPVNHFGLESSDVFLQKSKEALVSTVRMEQNKLVDDKLNKVQSTYKRLKKFGLQHVFFHLISISNKRILKNLFSEKPKVFFFNIYKLWYYTKLKRQENA